MLEKPAIQDETITACLQAEYDLHITQIIFLPLGGDLSTAVYRALADDGTPYFCKLRRGDLDEISVELPKFLSELGITQIIPPLETKLGNLWAVLDSFNLILYEYIEGTSGFEIELSEHHWLDFSTAMERIHSTIVPPLLSQKIKTDCFTEEWRTACRDIIYRLDKERFDDPITIGLAAFLRPRSETVLDLLEHAERLARKLITQTTEFVLCHSDIHPGNLFIDKTSRLFIVDWDYPMLAPKERDLMFIGGGQGFVGLTAHEEEMLFYRNYGQLPIDPTAMAYYRCERNIIDIAVECGRIFSNTLGDQDRSQSLEILTWLFGPGGSIEMAYKSLEKSH